LPSANPQRLTHHIPSLSSLRRLPAEKPDGLACRPFVLPSNHQVPEESLEKPARQFEDKRPLRQPAAISRRSVLRNAVRASLAGALIWSMKPGGAAAQTQGPAGGHLAWVWQFSDDGPPDKVRSVLAANGLGIILKTHDATDWMSRYDPSTFAITGASAVSALARYFEAGGVPFHAWAVVKGVDPDREANMAAAVIGAGARSLFLDLEPSDGGSFWDGTRDSALYFGRRFRRLQPNGWLAIAPDPRPWQVEDVPVAEFATFSNEFAPQTYWDIFDNSATRRLLRERGFAVGTDGVTPELTLDFTMHSLGRFGLPIRPVGQGASDLDSWRRFVSHAFGLGMGAVSVWRYGTSNPDVWSLLQQNPTSVKAQLITPQTPQVSNVRPVAPAPLQPAPASQPGPTSPATQAIPAMQTAASIDRPPVVPPALPARSAPAPPSPITLESWGSPRLPVRSGEATAPGSWPFSLSSPFR
jgi:hypothetical protein